MAQRVSVVFVDDIDGTEAVGTYSFGLEGTQYEIDLSEANADKLREVLAPFVAHGRKATARRRSSARSSNGSARGSSAGPSAAEIRAWARAEGHEVSERGRVPAELREAYAAAH